MTALCSGKICTIFPEKGALNFWKACTIALEYSPLSFLLLFCAILRTEVVKGISQKVCFLMGDVIGYFFISKKYIRKF